MNLFQDLKQRAKSFISGSTSLTIQDKISAKVVTLVGIIPKKTIPRQLAETISKPLGSDSPEDDPNIVAPKKVVSSLGKLTLDLIQVNNNLDKIVEVIQEDYKNTKELNKKESEEYKKRIANRFRRIGRKELGSSKFDLKSLVKNFAGSFFKGVGGAIRALSAFNFVDALTRGDAAGAIGALLGMASTYIPAIIGAVVGGMTSSIFGGIKNLFKGNKQPPAVQAPSNRPVQAPNKTPRFGGKLAKFLALGTSALALGGAFMSKDQDPERNRLEDLTQQQKTLVAPDKLVPIAQDDLKKFENLNKKFEKAIDFLLQKQKETPEKRPRQTGGGGGAPPPLALPGDPGQTIEGNVGEVISTSAKASYYDPSLGGINASGYKTAEGLPATSTGEGFVSSKFTAAAFPELIKNLPENMTTPHPTFRGGRTLASGQSFNVMVTDRTGKSAIVRVNDVGPGVKGHASNHMLDFSPALRDYFGANRAGGLKITMAPANATPGPITVQQAQQISSGQRPSIRPQSVQPRPQAQIRSMPQTPRTRTTAVTTPPTGSSRPIILPLPLSSPEPSQPLASTETEIDNVPSVTTSYSENFLTMYSKLIYQIV